MATTDAVTTTWTGANADSIGILLLVGDSTVVPAPPLSPVSPLVGQCTLLAVDSHTALQPSATGGGLAPAFDLPVNTATWKLPLRGPSDGTLAYSCERWLSFRFIAPFTAVTALRFWIDNLNLAPGWTLLYGLSDTYRNPATSRSAIAVHPLPITDPGIGNMPPVIGGTSDPFTDSAYLVLQASWEPGGASVIQYDGIRMKLGWRVA